MLLFFFSYVLRSKRKGKACFYRLCEERFGRKKKKKTRRYSGFEETEIARTFSFSFLSCFDVCIYLDIHLVSLF